MADISPQLDATATRAALNLLTPPEPALHK